MRFETLEHYRRFIFNRKWNQNFNRKLKQHFNTDKELVIPLVVHKIAISSPPKDGSCTIMIIYNHDNELAFCRIGDSSWTCLGNQFVVPFDDIIYSKKHQLFYAINGVGYVQAWDLKNPSFPVSKVIKYTYSQGSLKPPKEISKVKFSRCRYLVELPQGDILIVIRYQSSIREDGSLFCPESFDLLDRFPSKTVWFDLGKIDFEKQTLEPVDCLGDAVVFLGANESFSVSASDYPGLRPNCIYFSNDPPAYYRYTGKPYGGCDTGVFSLEDHSISHGYPFELGESQPPPIWVFSRP
ncbi:hypothetical protein JCGZ_02093 [Jatropha curcas]|uniref:KIB1-4 beta-propeller domain-containing protein n=1 Tax=Jatropha curcas TaxID=180498 RepID=A0A067L6G8_JATCU|nr:hypothetical protein JCGZ_02093 [Jatropha curcas]